MRRDEADYFIVHDQHLPIHARLINWARYVTPIRGGNSTSPIWKLGKSNGRQWHEPRLSVSIDTLDGHVIEKAVYALPEKERGAIRWAYCRRWVMPHKIRRELAVTEQGLAELIHKGRAMLTNRRV